MCRGAINRARLYRAKNKERMSRLRNAGAVREPPKCRDKACLVSTAHVFLLHAGEDARDPSVISIHPYCVVAYSAHRTVLADCR